MSTSLIKQIGLFLSPERTAQLCIENVTERLEELAEDDALGKDLVNFVKSAVKADSDLTTSERILAVADATSIGRKLQSGRINSYELLCNVRNFDQHMGLLLCNEENAKELRRDSAIDRLEQSEYPADWTFHLQPLHRPLHSWGGYRCVGDVSPELASQLQDGVRLSSSLVQPMLRLLEDRALPQPERRTSARKKFNSLFRPEVDPLCTFLAMKAGLLKPGVSRLEFESALVPCIITTWR